MRRQHRCWGARRIVYELEIENRQSGSVATLDPPSSLAQWEITTGRVEPRRWRAIAAFGADGNRMRRLLRYVSMTLTIVDSMGSGGSYYCTADVNEGAVAGGCGPCLPCSTSPTSLPRKPRAGWRQFPGWGRHCRRRTGGNRPTFSSARRRAGICRAISGRPQSHFANCFVRVGLRPAGQRR